MVCIVFDTARADSLEPYGAKPGSSPTVTDLADSGIAVQGVRATSCWTLPSHTSMFTGALPRGLGLGQAPSVTPQSAGPVLRAERHRMLPDVLRRAGYATQAVSTNMWVSPHSGFDTGFDQFVPIDSSRQSRLDGGRRQQLIWGLEAMRGVADDGAAEAGDVVSAWIDRVSSQPFFWFVNLVECHSPYLPPRPYSDVSLVERLRAADEARRHLNLKAIWRACTGAFEVPEDALDRMRRLYAGSVRYSDDWLELMLTRLQDSGVLDDTLVIVCSDHGENFGEGDLIAHCFSLDDRLIRVPFIVSGPGAEAFAGMRSLAELPERVARAVGVENHPWGNGAPASRLPVAQWDPPGTASDPRVHELVEEWGLGEETIRRLTTELTCAVEGRWKLVRRGADEELFDLESDPLELNPIRGAERIVSRADDVVLALQSALRHPAVTATVEHDARPARPGEVEEIEGQMRLLGYM